jgi:hypothetical protein
MSGFGLAASAEMLVLDLPVEERVRRTARPSGPSTSPNGWAARR